MYVHVGDRFQWHERVSEKIDTWGAFETERKVELVLSLGCRSSVLWGSCGDGGRREACLLLQPRSSGLGSAVGRCFVWRSNGDGLLMEELCWRYICRLMVLLIGAEMIAMRSSIDLRNRTRSRSFDIKICGISIDGVMRVRAP
jgi:hypothetical protein